MERQKKVVDASIVVKWFTHEVNSKEALSMMKSHINEEVVLIVPDLIYLEVLNAMRYKNQESKSLGDINQELWNLQLHVEKINEYILDKAVSISLKYDLTLYDSLYAAVSQIHGCPLITADEKLLKFPSAQEL
jgi:predicted nucleic acid-binding protein